MSSANPQAVIRVRDLRKGTGIGRFGPFLVLAVFSILSLLVCRSAAKRTPDRL
jgi:hypothetical protein